MIKVSYEKPRHYDLEKFPNAVWKYTIDESDFDVYGVAGGLLQRTPEGWQAIHWESATGEPAPTREQAILNILPFAIKRRDEWRASEKAKEDRSVERHHAAQELLGLFSTVLTDPFCDKLYVRDLGADRYNSNPLEAPISYEVTVKFSGLTEAQVRALASQLNEVKI